MKKVIALAIAVFLGGVDLGHAQEGWRVPSDQKFRWTEGNLEIFQAEIKVDKEIGQNDSWYKGEQDFHSVLPEGFVFCGWKNDFRSASQESWNVTKINSRGFSANVSLSSNNRGAWVHASFFILGVRLISQDADFPDCNSGGWLMAPKGRASKPAPISATCINGTLYCKVETDISYPTSTTPCGPCRRRDQTP